MSESELILCHAGDNAAAVGLRAEEECNSEATIRNFRIVQHEGNEPIERESGIKDSLITAVDDRKKGGGDG